MIIFEKRKKKHQWTRNPTIDFRSIHYFDMYLQRGLIIQLKIWNCVIYPVEHKIYFRVSTRANWTFWF